MGPGSVAHGLGHGESRQEQGEGVERHRRCDSGRKGPLKGGLHHSSLWRRRSGPSAPSTSLFFCLLDVCESRGAPRPCLGGPAFDPKRTFSFDGRPHSQRVPQLVFVEVFFSGVPQKTSRTECCCRRHKRSGGPTVPDSNRLGQKRGLIAGQSGPCKPGPPPGDS